MKYEGIINFFVEELPEIRPIYNKVKELLEDTLSPYVFCGTVLTPYIISKLNNNEEEKLKHIFSLLERLAINNDEMIGGILSLGILESLANEREIIGIAKKYMLTNTKNIYDIIEIKGGWGT